MWYYETHHFHSHIRHLAATIINAVQRQDTAHPVFSGCIDWHSSVHGHWALLRAWRIVREKEYLEVALAGLDPVELERERGDLLANHSFELPYGRAWFLQFALEFATVFPDDERLLPLAEVCVRTLISYLGNEVGEWYDPSIIEYRNQSWALYHLHRYLASPLGERHEQRAEGLALVRRRVLEEYTVPTISEDMTTPGFFSLWGNLMLLLTEVLPPTLARPVVSALLPEDEYLHPVRTLQNAHHLAINASRAWALWRCWRLTEEPRLLQYYLDHVSASLELHESYAEDYRAYGHWVPQFTLFAMTIDEQELGSGV